MAAERPSVNRRAAVLGLVVLASLAAGIAIRAAGTTVHDANDTRGLLDAKTVRLIRAPGAYPRWSVQTFAAWTIPELWDRGYVSIEFDTRFGAPADFYALVRSVGSRMEARLFRVRPSKPNDLVVAKLKVRRGADDGLSVWVPLRALTFGESRTTFGWWALTMFTGDRCPATCFDRVPDTGVEEAAIPGASPSPTSSSPPPTSFAPPPGG
jgi:hypothetical protein